MSHRAKLPAPTGAHGDYDHLTNDKHHNPLRRRGFARKESKATMKTCLSTMDAVGRSRGSEIGGAMDTSEHFPLSLGDAVVAGIFTQPVLLIRKWRRNLRCSGILR